jgi:hypothetical protein
VFESKYGFGTEKWLIPTKRSHHKLMGKALDFIDEFDSNDNLFIVYYAGHGSINEHRQAVWSCRRELDYASVEWSAIQSLFEKASSDVLILLDCCSAASSASKGGIGVTETIAACGFVGRAPPPGQYSFTNTLIEVLDDWVAKPSFSAALLHTEILFQLKRKRPEKGRPGSKKMEWCSTPIHFICTSDPKSPSIELSRREVVTADQPNGDSPPYSPRLETNSPAQRTTTYTDAAELHMCDLNALRPNPLTSTTPTGKLSVPHVLMSIALEEDQPELDVEAWRRYLSAFPALVKYAKVQGVYMSHSTLLVLSVPIMIWDMIPGNAACAFIGYVTSNNIAQDREVRPGFLPRVPTPPRGTDFWAKSKHNITFGQPEAENDDALKEWYAGRGNYLTPPSPYRKGDFISNISDIFSNSDDFVKRDLSDAEQKPRRFHSFKSKSADMLSDRHTDPHETEAIRLGGSRMGSESDTLVTGQTSVKFRGRPVEMNSLAKGSPLSSPHSQARIPLPEEWEARKPRIEELYVNEERTLQDVMSVLKDEAGFIAKYHFLILPFFGRLRLEQRRTV